MAIAYNDDRQVLKQDATYLFSTGDRFQLTGTIWEGKQARAIYTDHPTVEGPMQQLEVASESLEAQQKQRSAARLKAENEVQ
ncbi:hypothetical protein [Hymenobacter sp. BRD67]|uniref:hypothetical protein n=1 Tax=Hymenobacter sp. BRD67 TaxID=2675877 RepID=UPI00156449E3|nr:hypothetical protein [Hymenobacter sp. BRD67]QKG51834.1 hypothetical protein GKZ67_03465 [Hymenobacter sp. BRD67]